jgi:hypothetical protein
MPYMSMRQFAEIDLTLKEMDSPTLTLISLAKP